jgi:hypothetical protein
MTLRAATRIVAALAAAALAAAGASLISGDPQAALKLLLWPISASVAGVPVGVWVYAFIFWTPVSRWWYARVLRKPYPVSPPRPRG